MKADHVSNNLIDNNIRRILAVPWQFWSSGYSGFRKNVIEAGCPHAGGGRRKRLIFKMGRRFAPLDERLRRPSPSVPTRLPCHAHYDTCFTSTLEFRSDLVATYPGARADGRSPATFLVAALRGKYLKERWWCWKAAKIVSRPLCLCRASRRRSSASGDAVFSWPPMRPKGRPARPFAARPGCPHCTRHSRQYCRSDLEA